MSRFPHCALVRSYVLNNLENGPARVADLVRRGRAEFGFSLTKSKLRPNTSPSSHELRRGNILDATGQLNCHLVGLGSRS